MLLPLSALEDYFKLKVTPEKLAEKLLLSGTKVEGINKVEGEIIFDLEITPNRADTLSFYGIAREISAIFDLDLTDPDTELLIDLKKPTKKYNFKVVDKKLCPYYSLVKLDNIVIKDSPSWIKQTLKLSGIRPLNNVIDITNLVMLELDQPMHAFDSSKIKGTPTVRASKKGEKVITLDSVERSLPEGSIIIEDDNGLIDLAGLMGGKNSEVDENTNEVFLLVPFYEPTAIRKASLFTGLRTEASNRFEKKLDPNMHPTALNRAIKLLVENTGAHFASAQTNVGFPVAEKSLNFDSRMVKQVLGIDLTQSEIVNLLTPLGFITSTQPLDETEMLIRIPSHRPDVSLPEDILEEIGRIYGYNNFPKTLPQGEIPVQEELFEPDKEQICRDYLLNCGFFETTGYSLVSEADLKKISFQPNNALAVLHPTSSDFVFLRPSLIINLLKAASINQEREQISFFEIAKEFGKEVNPRTKLPEQNEALALVSNQAFGSVKSILETLLSKFSFEFQQKSNKEVELISFGTNYEVSGKIIAKVGIVNREILNRFEIKTELTYVWVDLDYLSKSELNVDYKPLAKFPSVIEDISFYTPKKDSAGEIVKYIEGYNKLIESVEIVDAFEKEGNLSLTLRLNFRSESETLTSKDATTIRERLEKDLAKKFKIDIRKE